MAVPVELWIVLPFILVGAALYTSVGHGGATIYLALLTLAGFAVDVLVTTVLALNILAAGIAFGSFHHGGHLRPRLLWPFLVTSVPAAYLGGAVDLGGRTTELLLGVALLVAALRFLLVRGPPSPRPLPARRTLWIVAPVLGAVLGLLAGAVGIGGGIFLSPLLLFLGWANVKESAAIASAFIVLNSIAGLAARFDRTPVAVDFLFPLAVAVVVGALLGAFLGAVRLPRPVLQLLLGVVLILASLKALLP